METGGEPVEAFLRDLQLKARSCNFGTLRESMIRDQIVFGAADDQLRERLLREDSLTLEDAIKAAQSAEMAASQKKKVGIIGSKSCASQPGKSIKQGQCARTKKNAWRTVESVENVAGRIILQWPEGRSKQSTTLKKRAVVCQTLTTKSCKFVQTEVQNGK